jgi:hypothetical protein
MVQQLKEQDLTAGKIGEHLGQSESWVKQYSALLSNIVTKIIEMAKLHQKGRVTNMVTDVTFNFTEGWFRDSGFYTIDAKHQKQFMDDFIEDWFKINSANTLDPCSDPRRRRLLLVMN